MSTKHIFPLYLEGAAQSVAANATAVNWNGTSSLVNCANTSNATLTLASAEPGTVVVVRKESGAGTVAVRYPAATTLYTLSATKDSTVAFIWDSTGWDLFQLSNTPSTAVLSVAQLISNGPVTGSMITLTKANITQATSRNQAVTANGAVGTITTFSGAAMTSGTTYSFTLNSNLISGATSRVIVSAGNNAADIHKLAAHTVTTGSCTITYTSDGATSNPAIEINYLVIN